MLENIDIVYYLLDINWATYFWIQT